MFDFKMPLTDAIAVSLIGITTVIAILAVIALLIILVSKAIRAIENAANKKNKKAVAEAAQPAEAAVPAPAGVPMPAGMNQGELELVNTDEKTAAVIMAIVSDKSGIPLNRLSFKSIKLMEDE